MPKSKFPTRPKSYDWSRFIVQHTPGAVITLNARRRITEFNPAAERLTGYSREEAIGQPVAQILHYGDESEFPWDQVMSGNEEFTQEMNLNSRSGQKVPVMVSSFALREEAGGPRGAAIIIRDLTLIKRLDTERRRQVNMFAHDLKTPVVGIGGLIRRLRQGKVGPLTPEQKTYLEIIDREMKRLEKLITSLLEFARLDLRLYTPQPENIRVEDECREVIALLNPLAEAKGMELKTVLPATLRPLRVDPLLFRRVLENLIGNAIKFSPPKTKVLLEVLEQKKEVRFAVKDQGPGIPPEELPNLFEFFYRGQAAGETEGFGLGLATVKRIIDGHGGRIWVESQPGKGATFYFTFPREYAS